MAQRKVISRHRPMHRRLDMHARINQSKQELQYLLINAIQETDLINSVDQQHLTMDKKDNTICLFYYREALQLAIQYLDSKIDKL